MIENIRIIWPQKDITEVSNAMPYMKNSDPTKPSSEKIIVPLCTFNSEEKLVNFWDRFEATEASYRNSPVE